MKSCCPLQYWYWNGKAERKVREMIICLRVVLLCVPLQQFKRLIQHQHFNLLACSWRIFCTYVDARTHRRPKHGECHGEWSGRSAVWYIALCRDSSPVDLPGTDPTFAHSSFQYERLCPSSVGGDCDFSPRKLLGRN